MGIIELYKKHINPSPGGTEIYNLFKTFGIGDPIIMNPLSESWNKSVKNYTAENDRKCREWILKNSRNNE